MNTARREALRLIAYGLQFYGSVSGGELMTRLIGLLSEKEAWGIIAEAERMGMIEHAEMIFESSDPRAQEWRLVKGFNVERLEIPT